MRWICVLAFTIGGLGLWAQGDLVFIEQITMEGNRRTRDEIILRELKFQVGDSIPINQLEYILEESERLVMNTGLFNSANITIKNWRGADNHVHFHLVLAETWYLYPIPVFELADRNFNVWWVEQNHSLQRVNFGIEFTHLNFSGQKDRLRLTAKYGYTRTYAVNYTLPFINRSQTFGIDAGISFAQNREINYASEDNKQAFYRDEDGGFMYQRFRARLGFSFRPAYHQFHDLELGFRQNQIGSIIAEELNPDFFLEGRKLQRAISLAYRFVYDHRDVQAYPLQGGYFSAELQKVGLGWYRDQDALHLLVDQQYYRPLSERWSTGFRLNGKLSFLRGRQPFNDYRALGYNETNLFGYEYYIVNGLDMGMGRAFLRYRLLSKDLKFGKIVPISAFRRMPVKVYLSLNQGAGIVNDPYTGIDNPFANRWLWGGGIGLDIVLYYDKVLQIQYSYNHLWEKGVFLHFSANI